MPLADNVSKVAQIAATVAGLQPELAIIMKLVQGGFIGVQMVRAFYASKGHDPETLDAIVAECDKHIARWEGAKF